MPNTSPTARATPKASATLIGDTTAEKSAKRSMEWAISTPSTVPAIPPATESSPASATNWATTSRAVAPTARRTPISRTRSCTVASMMFMMPIPPTRSDIPAMAASTALNIRCSFCSSCRSCSGSTRAKSSTP